jgi:hypothetical protein
MAGNRKRKRFSFSVPACAFICAILWCAPGAFLFGQERDYRIEKDGRLIQTLRWSEQENALYYGVEIDRRQGNAVWEEFLRGETETAFFEVSLAPGTYRLRVRVYDFLGRPAAITDWNQFEVLPALQPEISRFGPEAFYLDEDLSWVLNLSGESFSGETKIYLQSRNAESSIVPESVTVDEQGDGVRLVFSYEQLDAGEYVIYAVNPGGFETSVGIFTIAFKKPLDINISAGYRPLFSLYGQINDLLGINFYSRGAYARFNFIPLKRQWGYMGFELEPFWNYLYNETDDYQVQARMTGAVLYGVYQWWFPNRIMALNFRAGGGVYAIMDFHFTHNHGDSEPLTTFFPALALGGSFQWFIFKPFFMEAGVDFTHLFSADNPPPGYLRPFMGGGWQF